MTVMHITEFIERRQVEEQRRQAEEEKREKESAATNERFKLLEKKLEVDHSLNFAPFII